MITQANPVFLERETKVEKRYSCSRTERGSLVLLPAKPGLEPRAHDYWPCLQCGDPPPRCLALGTLPWDPVPPMPFSLENWLGDGYLLANRLPPFPDLLQGCSLLFHSQMAQPVFVAALFARAGRGPSSPSVQPAHFTGEEACHQKYNHTTKSAQV